MEKKITFRTWIFVFIGGIWQFICNIFSWKNKTPFWRVIWATITVCIVTFTTMLGYSFYDEYYGERSQRYETDYHRTYVGDHYYFTDKGRNKGRSFISEVKSDKKVLTGLDWIGRPEDGDSLIVFAKDNKRGYFNYYTGEIVIPAKYDAAWCFNDGVAGVCVGDSVLFIDHSDKPINSHKYKRTPNRNYTYYGNFFIFADKNRHGLINRAGEISVPAIYEDITPMYFNTWLVNNDDKYGVIDESGELILPCIYKSIAIYPEGGIVVSLDDNTKKRYDYEGVLMDDFVYDYIHQLEYSSNEFDEDGNRIPKSSKLYVYDVDDYKGLMDKDGHPITLPKYSYIDAISNDLYYCRIAGTLESVTLNEKGEKVNP